MPQLLVLKIIILFDNIDFDNMCNISKLINF